MTTVATRKRTIKPIKARTVKYARLSEAYQEAVQKSPGTVPAGYSIRIETYRTKDIRYLIEKVWRWPATLVDLTLSDDRRRVRTIMRLIPKEGQWPYVSYYADDMEELMETAQEDGPLGVPNHGDGWHRIIAAVELKLPTIDVVFFYRYR